MLFFLTACNSGQSSVDIQSPSTGTDGKYKHIEQAIGDNDHYKPLTAKSELVGIWASDNKEPVTVNITSDSIYYTEHFVSYKYSIKEDSIFISYPDFTFAAKVYFNRDTLLLESEDGKSIYHKFKS